MHLKVVFFCLGQTLVAFLLPPRWSKVCKLDRESDCIGMYCEWTRNGCITISSGIGERNSRHRRAQYLGSFGGLPEWQQDTLVRHNSFWNGLPFGQRFYNGGGTGAVTRIHNNQYLPVPSVRPTFRPFVRPNVGLANLPAYQSPYLLRPRYTDGQFSALSNLILGSDSMTQNDPRQPITEHEASYEESVIDQQTGNQPLHREDHWENWEQWSQCSVTCGSGTLNRFRYCDQSKQCLGMNYEDKPCQIDCSVRRPLNNAFWWNG